MSNLKIEGKVGDFCPNCKNCKAVTRMHDGETASIRLTEVECVDPYDGMAKTLDADGDICCSMFEPKPPCEKSERFDRTYCHGPNGTITISYKAVFGEPVNCPSYEEKKEKEPCDKISCLQHELEMDKLRMKIHQLEKEKVAHMKGIERLKKSQEKLQNQVKNLQTTNEESYKREENKRFDRLNTEFLIPLVRILYPGEKVCKPYPEILKDIKLLNKGVYDLKEDNKRLADKNKALFEENLDRLDKHTKQCQEIDNLRNELLSLKTINKGLAEDRKKLINYMRSLKIASDNYLKEFTYTYKED